MPISTVEEAVQAALIGATAVTTLVPADRIRVPGDWQKLAAPYIVHFPSALQTTLLMDAMAASKTWLYQVSIFASTYSAARAIATQVKLLMQHGNFSGVQTFLDGEHPAPYESDVQIQQIVLEFRVTETF